MRADLIELGERIAENAAHVDAAMHRLLADLREFDEKGGWHHAGAQSCAHWLSWRVGWDLATARDRVRVARKLGELPKIDDALRKGEVSYSKARAMVRVGTPQNEELLLSYSRGATASHMEKICRKYQMVRRLGERERVIEIDRRYFAQRRLDDGMVRIEVVVRAEEAEVVFKTTREAAKRVSAETFSQVDGFMAVFEHAARGEAPNRTPIEVIVTVPERGLTADGGDETAEVERDGCVSAETARRLACDCGVVRVTESETGEVLDVGRKTRTIPASIKRALLRRDGTCRFPGCENTLFVDGHHVKHWADGGETALGNLVTLCGLCRARHKEHYAEYLVMPRRPRLPDGESTSYAA